MFFRRYINQIIIFIGLALFFLGVFPPALLKNIGNISLVKAIYAKNYVEQYFWAQNSVENYVFADSMAFDIRLEEMYRLLWEAASNINKEAVAIDAFQVIHDSSIEPYLNCHPTLGRIEAEEFSGIKQGSMSVLREIDGKLVVLMFSSQPISYTVCIPKTGIYELKVFSRENTPPPIDLQVKWDEWSAGTIIYEKGDLDWTSKSKKIATPKGQHVLQLDFTNDFRDPVENIDRNAMVDYIEIIKLEEGE